MNRWRCLARSARERFEYFNESSHQSTKEDAGDYRRNPNDKSVIPSLSAE